MEDDKLDTSTASRLDGSEIAISLAELELLCGKDGGLRWDDGTVTACRADGSVVRVLRRPDDPPLRVV